MSEQASAPEDVRIEIPWSGQDHSKTTAKSTRITIAFGAAFAGPMVLVAIAGSVRDGESPWLFILLYAIFLPIGLLVFRSVLETRNISRHQAIVIQAGRLTIERQNALREACSTFEVLQMHDLRVLPWDLGSEALGVPVVRYNAPMASERIAFTYRGTAHSFGGPADDKRASEIVAQIAEYDGRLRASLGMPEEPNITTCDQERISRSFSVRDGWDADVAPGAL